ncbi:MAG TPA: type II toxin-antitoxin system VapB family antitoxin [Armatimonadota bacterium]|nr:type II toxin-antitoxin system VapB family antitoxin [Armatimonadota bacterium]
MAENSAIEDQLLTEAVKLGGHRTRKEAVIQALTDYVQRVQQQKILELFGTIEFDPDYDYKRLRERG